MTRLFVLALSTLAAAQGFAAPETYSYICSGSGPSFQLQRAAGSVYLNGLTLTSAGHGRYSHPNFVGGVISLLDDSSGGVAVSVVTAGRRELYTCQ